MDLQPEGGSQPKQPRPLPPPPKGPPPWFKDTPGTVHLQVRVLTPDHPDYASFHGRLPTVKALLSNSPKASTGELNAIEWIDPYHGNTHIISLALWVATAEEALVQIKCSFRPQRV